MSVHVEDPVVVSSFISTQRDDLICFCGMIFALIFYQFVFIAIRNSHFRERHGGNLAREKGSLGHTIHYTRKEKRGRFEYRDDGSNSR